MSLGAFYPLHFLGTTLTVATIEVRLTGTRDEFLLFHCQLSFKQSFKNFTVLQKYFVVNGRVCYEVKSLNC